MKLIRTLWVLLGVLGQFATPVATAQQVPVPPFLLKNGGQVVAQRQVEGGLTMWTLLKNGKRVIIFTTPDQKVMLMGTLFDATSGSNLSDKYFLENPPSAPAAAEAPLTVPSSANLPAKPAAPATAPAGAQSASKDPVLYMRDTLLGVWDTTTGKPPAANAPVVYIFFDPLCPYCHELYRNTRALAARGAVMKWIPVQALGPKGPPLSAAMLRQGTASLRAMASKGLQAVEPSAAEYKGLQDNTLMATSLAYTVGKRLATPLMVYRDPSGKLSLLFDSGQDTNQLNQVFWESLGNH
ncbi:MAG: hypothetical protein JNM52_10340 [Betaproteobacteria bacterium]|nr:hypothetical protein [Betaproteobacteria bacterium]